MKKNLNLIHINFIGNFFNFNNNWTIVHHVSPQSVSLSCLFNPFVSLVVCVIYNVFIFTLQPFRNKNIQVLGSRNYSCVILYSCTSSLPICMHNCVFSDHSDRLLAGFTTNITRLLRYFSFFPEESHRFSNCQITIWISFPEVVYLSWSSRLKHIHYSWIPLFWPGDLWICMLLK